jgi:hypothetical protein
MPNRVDERTCRPPNDDYVNVADLERRTVKLKGIATRQFYYPRYSPDVDRPAKPLIRPAHFEFRNGSVPTQKFDPAICPEPD